MEIIRQYKFSLLLTLAITLLSVLPIPEQAPLHDVPLIDKWVHFLMYAALSLALWMDRKGYRRQLPNKTYGMMFVLPTLLGCILELVQAYLTTCRSGELMDAIADGIGAFIGTVIGFFLQGLWKKNTSPRN